MFLVSHFSAKVRIACCHQSVSASHSPAQINKEERESWILLVVIFQKLFSTINMVQINKKTGSDKTSELTIKDCNVNIV